LTVRIATRGSALARWQAEHVASLLGDAALVIVETIGDRDKATSLSQLGGTGIFTKEVQAALLDGRADVAVHSAKDLPSNPALATPGLVIGAVPARADVRDALVGSALAELPPGGVVATGSARRRALLADLRPDLTFDDLRGNIDTRLARASASTAVVVAHAALVRLGLTERAAEVLDPAVMVPQVGQGALALEVRAGEESIVATLEDADSRRAVDAERTWLATIGGGCDLPVGAHATVEGDDVRLDAVLASFDGRVVLRDHESGTDPHAVGAALAERMLAQGGRWLIDG
jgi:hydroxymethylbilane synthase